MQLVVSIPRDREREGGSGSMSERFINTGSLCSGFKAIWSI